MSRYSRWLGACLAIILTMLPVGSVLAKEGSQGEIATSTLGEGFENPPNADKNGPSYVNPCLGHEDYESHVSRSTGLVMNDIETVGVEFGDDTITVESSGFPAAGTDFSLTADSSFEVEFVQWMTACAPEADSALSAFEPGTTTRYWIRRPTQEALVPGLLVEVGEALPAPEISWPSADPEFGWIYVNTESDVRIGPVGTVYRERTRSNLVGSATAWVEATPSEVRFDPGEPNKSEIPCTYESAIAQYIPSQATGCKYKYTNSSAISTDADSAFVARTSVLWEISASGPFTSANPLSWREDLVQVAEVQAIVIAGP